MSNVNIKFPPTTLEAIHALRIQVELKEGQNIRASRSVSELVKLLEIASRSTNPEVQQAFKKLVSLFSVSHLTYFKSVGLDLEIKTANKKDISYRGTRIEKAAGAAPDTGEKKRKIIYRGQEKWV